ncbi:polypeptide N-acetylgalactosaminyltransferase 6-like, partial [Mercenaria mercenaria]|uniref:polypeptide N-acetylgalactosaminyltransferase 6-like n=1 Tax=Mercenaria mercenaria TaxID=6596 RepID=UPI00234EBCAF
IIRSFRQERNKFHGFNTFISDMIGLHRKLPEMRPSECKRKVNPINLPPVTVVIIFRDEWYSILLRMVYSVLETSPPHLIYKIILVDDGSTKDDLIACIKIHVQNVDKLTLVQKEKPLGLMMARQTSINAVRSELFAVMDGHMEIKCLLNKEKRNHSVEPNPAGTLQGMMMVMRKDFFMHMGRFDSDMRAWGSEQIEVSVKVWLCGGVIEMVPCSKVAHMFRQ